MFGPPKPPKPMQSVSDAFVGVDFTAMPEKSFFTARDGRQLCYRAYPGDPARVAILVHGSSGTSESMHAVAHAIAATGATVHALGLRGHDGNGRSGDVAYVGQIADDLADFLDTLPKGTRPALLGFSSGGGFVLRIAGSPLGARFSRFILVSPQLPPGAPTFRPNAGGWASVALPRIVALEMLHRAGIGAFAHLPVIEFAVAPQMLDRLTPRYSYRMLKSFGPSDDYLGDLKRAPAPVVLLAGAEDEMFYADKYAPLLKPARPDLTVTILPGLSHMEMTTKPQALDALAAAVQG
jgi:pimeloyl-ACP methyl ester carboxylesterase